MSTEDLIVEKLDSANAGGVKSKAARIENKIKNTKTTAEKAQGIRTKAANTRETAVKVRAAVKAAKELEKVEAAKELEKVEAEKVSEAKAIELFFQAQKKAEAKMLTSAKMQLIIEEIVIAPPQTIAKPVRSQLISAQQIRAQRAAYLRESQRRHNRNRFGLRF